MTRACFGSRRKERVEKSKPTVWRNKNENGGKGIVCAHMRVQAVKVDALHLRDTRTATLLLLALLFTYVWMYVNVLLTKCVLKRGYTLAAGVSGNQSHLFYLHLR